ncbi:hypothetical protein BB561_006708, partial [Smittium simulii]
NHSSPELSDAQLKKLKVYLHLLTMKYNFSDFTGNITGENNSNNINSILEICNMVSNNIENGNNDPNQDIGNRSHTRPKKRQISALKEQGMEANRMKSQRTKASKTEQWKSTTIRSYNSAIISLLVDSTLNTEDPLLKEFLKAVDETSIASYTRTNIDISPIINQIRIWASDIHRIDDAQTIVKEDKIIFKIIVPKEKKKGKPIERNCTISAHRDKILCPVLTYNTYKLNIARDLCPRLHQNFDAISVNRILRYIKDYNKPLSVDSITGYIHKLSKLIDRPHNTPIPKARAIGVTLAAEAGIPSDQIISHAFWFSYNMFDLTPSENKKIVFAHTMGVLLADLEIMILQLIVGASNKKINLVEKQSQIYELDKESLFEPETLNTLVTEKHPQRNTDSFMPF